MAQVSEVLLSLAHPAGYSSERVPAAVDIPLTPGIVAEPGRDQLGRREFLRCDRCNGPRRGLIRVKLPVNGGAAVEVGWCLACLNRERLELAKWEPKFRGWQFRHCPEWNKIVRTGGRADGQDGT